MTRLRLIALTLPLAMMSAAALADGGSTASEFEHQADAGKWEVTPGFTFGSFKSNYSSTCSFCSANGGLTSQTDSQFNFNVKGEYGINEMLSVGLNLGYSSDSESFSPSGATGLKYQGMADPTIFVNGRNDLGVGSIHWGAILDIGLQKQTVNSTTASESSNGFTFTPFVGYEAMVGPGILGAKVSYDLIQTNKSWVNNTADATNFGETETTKNGNLLTFLVFWEMNFNPVIWGVDVGLINHASTTTNYADGTSQGNSDNFTAFTVATYANWAVTPDIFILPTIGFGPNRQSINANSLIGATSESGFYGTIAARFAF
jgi:hypothetical protein